MNGFMMCILLAATGQVGSTTERDFGWQINPNDGKLEYVVQLSPQNVKDMTSAAQEKESDVPTEVAARLSRVVVRIGTEPIVSTPMEEVMKLPVVTTAVLANIEASAGRGRFSQLETAPPGEVRNVAGDGNPPSLSSGPSSLPEAPGTSLADQASQLGSSLSDALKSDISGAISSRSAEAMRNAQNLLAQNLTQNTPGSALLNESRGISTGPGKFANTATQPATPAAGSSSTGLPSSPSSSLGSPAAAGNYPTSPAHNHAPGDGFHNDGTAAAPPLNSSIGSSSPLSGGLGSSGFPANSAGSNIGSGLNSGQSYNGSAGQYAGSPTSGYNQPGYNNSSPGSTVPGYNGASTSGMTNNGMTPLNNNPAGGNFGGGNFGGYPRGNATQAPYGQYATAGTGSSVGSQYPYGQSAPAYGTSNAPAYGGVMPPQYAPDPLSLPSGSQQPIRMADNRGATALPSTSGVTTTSGSSNTNSSSHSDTGKDRKTNDDRDTADTYANSHSGMDNVLPVMFVLSLVVNFYLGMLIRKLLGRYRSLLSSVRSQAV